MLLFHSAKVRIVNSERAVTECMEIAFGETIPSHSGVVIFHATLGHKVDRVGAAIKQCMPGVTVVGNSCGAVTGREGVGESMNELSMMMFTGPKEEYAVAAVHDIYGHNSYEKGLVLAKSLNEKLGGINTIYLLCPGIDSASDLVIQAFDEVFGSDVTLFGGTSSDNMQSLSTYQYADDKLCEHSAWAVGFADPTLKAVTRATHGFAAYGEPMLVTKAQGNRIFELDGKQAWEVYKSNLSLTGADVRIADTVPIGALAEELPKELAEEYGNPHILRAVSKFDETDGSLFYPTTCRQGLKLWLTTRDENLIFSEQQRSLNYLIDHKTDKEIVAVFQADCLARGRALFNRIMKDEIIGMMHASLSNAGEVPPWLGMYGSGEYAKLGGRNTFHNYTTALLVLYR